MKKKYTFYIGEVTSNKMTKTITASVKKNKKHLMYKKTVLFKRKYNIHDENNYAKIGDIIMFKQNKPISKNKFWVLKCIL